MAYHKNHFFVPLQNEYYKFYASCNFNADGKTLNVNLLHPELGTKIFDLDYNQEDDKFYYSKTSEIDQTITDSINNFYHKQNIDLAVSPDHIDLTDQYVYINITQTHYAVGNAEYGRDFDGIIPTGIISIFENNNGETKQYEVERDYLSDNFYSVISATGEEIEPTIRNAVIRNYF
ncbi:MAG: hypothetical protein BGN92_07040 [Sphingobacteriales bacterium 41-5]|nr:MAG: hypothetical protein BGN92_07040 [Sphingobacteriales bacterium 41-5]